MLITTSTVVAVWCPACDRMDFHLFSLFSCTGGKPVKIHCSCGASMVQVSTSDFNEYQVQARCVMCESRHVWRFHRGELCSPKAMNLRCPVTDLDIGFIGPKEQVKQLVRKLQEKPAMDMPDEPGFSGYFDNPAVAFTLLEGLYHNADAGRIVCQCGNRNIELEIFPERVELRCGSCQVGGTIQIHEPDLSLVRTADGIKLTGEGIVYLPESRNRSHR